MTTDIAIVAHPARRQMVRELARHVQPGIIAWDNARMGAARNHLQAWGYLKDGPQQWAVILEDDCIPVADFRTQLTAMLAKAPGNIVSLYLGRGRPDQWQLPISAVIAQEACFLRADELLHGVGYALRTPTLRALYPSVRAALAHLHRPKELVALVSIWARKNEELIYYTRPSLVNHRDDPPLIADEDREDGQSRSVPPDPSGSVIRKAWLFGSRPHWDSSCTDLPRPDLRRRDKVSPVGQL